MAMRWLRPLPLMLALLMLGSQAASAGTVYGDLNNFDAVNDTGAECRGFQIEIQGARSTDITYTYDWNHYGPPRITEDISIPGNPKVFIRYESPKNLDGSWVSTAHTDVPTQILGPTNGHYCTDPINYSYGCEHFGVGYYGSPTAVKYNWLHDGGSGNLVLGPAVNVATPTFVYSPPVLVDPALPPDPANIAVPAQVVAAIPAPVVPDPAGKEFGVPSWVKVIKTTTHNAGNVALADLVSDEDAGGVLQKWQNNEAAEVESEWKLLQTNNGANPAKAEVVGLADDMGGGNETVTRRYEFYKYAGNAFTIDGENNEAMCDEVSADNLHGVGTAVAVTDANGDTQSVDCTAQVVVGDYIGAQMAGFAAEAPLGLVDNIQDGELSTPYTPRTVVVGGNSPFTINIIAGSLPPDLAIAAVDGVLSGTPTSGGNFSFTVQATDADNIIVSKAYTMNVVGGVVPTSCPAGTFSATGSTPCTPAPVGSYASGTGNTSATLCPAGTFSDAEGAAACTSAPAGSYASGTGNVLATLCPVGTFSSAAGVAACTSAPAGSYASGTGNVLATLCPAGTTSDAGASVCTPIAPNLVINSATAVHNGSNIDVTVIIGNNGGPTQAVTIGTKKDATIDGKATKERAPVVLGDIAPGGTATTILTFAGVKAGTRTLQVTLTYTGGTATLSTQISVP
jgi:hypothetical protein